MPSVRSYFFCFVILCYQFSFANTTPNFFPGDHPNIQYTGRIDFTNAKLPRFWQPAVYIEIKFSGNYCDLIVNDEVLWGVNHNYYELVVDGKPYRLQTKAKRDTIKVSPYLQNAKEHTVVFVKNTEANIGYLEFVGVICEQLLDPGPKQQRKIEFIGNSITCGASSDVSEIACGKGVWHDQHNAYMSYASITGRALNAQYHLSSVSGIGLMRSCCGMKIIMPQVYDKINMRNDTITWNFKNYQPDVVTVCLGQNDGIQDSATFCNNYLSFLKKLREYHPKATFILLSSPMASDKLKEFMRGTITSITKVMNAAGDKKVYQYIFEKQYKNGCDWHPSLDEHIQIASEVTPFIKKIMNW